MIIYLSFQTYRIESLANCFIIFGTMLLVPQFLYLNSKDTSRSSCGSSHHSEDSMVLFMTPYLYTVEELKIQHFGILTILN